MLPRLNPADCTLLIVDVQTRILPEMWEAQRVERNLVMLAQMAQRLEIPVVVSQQNRQIGWERMTRAGAVPSSTEAALYELLGEAGTDDFRAMLSLVK